MRKMHNQTANYISFDKDVELSNYQNWSSLIDFTNIPNGIISGKSGLEVEKMAQESLISELNLETQKEMSKLDIQCPFSASGDGMNFSDVPDELEKLFSDLNFEIPQEIIDLDKENTFVELDPEIIAELNIAELAIRNKATDTQTANYVKKFKDFLLTKNLSVNFENISNELLDQYMRYFYSTLATKYGNPMAPATLLCIRSSLNRYLNSQPINRPVNLCTDSAFISSNKMLKVMVGKFIKEGGKIQHFSPIERTDLDKLSKYFDRSTPKSLQDEIIFNIIYYFGQRGRENIRMLKRSDFRIETSSTGSRFVDIKVGLEAKNVKASLNKRAYSDEKQAKMFELKGSPSSCPVLAFEFYLSKLPSGSDILFPKPLSNFTMEWYSAKAVRGKDYLGDLMKYLSKQLDLSKNYTNHCIRATVVSNMLDAGHDVSDVAAVTGHKSTEALRKYASYKRENQIESFSHTLNSSLHHNASQQTAIPEGPSAKRMCMRASHTERHEVNQRAHQNNDLSGIFGSGNSISIGTMNVYITQSAPSSP